MSPSRRPTSKPVGRISLHMTKPSSISVSHKSRGIFWVEKSACGTRTCVPCMPSMVWPTKVSKYVSSHWFYLAILQISETVKNTYTSLYSMRVEITSQVPLTKLPSSIVTMTVELSLAIGTFTTLSGCVDQNPVSESHVIHASSCLKQCFIYEVLCLVYLFIHHGF